MSPLSLFKVIGPVMVMMAEKSSVPVCVHLDHGDKLKSPREALEMGFTQVGCEALFPAPFEGNAANKDWVAVEMAETGALPWRAEIGAMGRQ